MAKVPGASLIAIAIGVATAVSGCTPPRPRQPTPPLLMEAVPQGETQYDAIALHPARTGWLPGFVFRGRADQRMIQVDEVVCPKLFPSAPIESDDALYSTVHKTTSFNAALSLDLLKKIADAASVKFDLAKLEYGKDYTLDYGKVQYMYLTLAGQFVGKQPQPIPDECQTAIDILKKNHQFENSVWILTGVTAATGVKYTFTNDFKANSELSASFAKLLNATASLGYTNHTENGITTITADKPVVLRVGVPLLVKDWVRSGAVGAQEAARIEAEPQTQVTTEVTGPMVVPPVVK